METRRISYIDMAKGIGIFLVVAGHMEFLPEKLFIWVTSFHMPLFFILSGMLLSYTNATDKPLSVLLQKKACRILIPYITFSAVSILLTFVLDTAEFASYLPNALMQTFTFYGISVLWFLPALFFGEAVFLLIRKKNSHTISGLILLLLCLLTILTVNTYHYHYEIDFNSTASLFGAYLIAVFVRTGIAVTFLAMGYYLQLFFFNRQKKRSTYIIYAIVFGIFSLILALTNGNVDLNYLVFNNYLFYFSAALSGSLFLICLCAALPEIKLLEAAGKHSLIIMATHMNCRFMGLCYAVGNVLLRAAPFLGNAGYVLTCSLLMIFLEIAAIYIINRFFPFLIGQKKHHT